jgi:hypothetical protein
MVELKTKKTTAAVGEFLNQITDEQKRKDCQAVSSIMAKATRAKPRMWGTAIIGFGERRYRYPDGREIDWMVIGLSPRKANITLYLNGFAGQDELLKDLGTHACGKGCLYIKRLSDVHVPTLKKIVAVSVRNATQSNRRSRR